ncbi:hypothetical protein ACFWA3_47855, partial [Streptomyces sp. NPDC059970]
MAGLAVLAVLAGLAGLALPAVAPSPAWAVTNGNAYVANYTASSVTVIDTSTNTPTITIGAGSSNYKLAATPDSTRVYVTDFSTSSVSVIDTSTNTVSTTITGITNPFGDAIAANASASLSIAKSHTGHFTQGQRGTYTITVGNTGPGPTNGRTVTVHDTLPTGLTATRLTGTGWNCTRSTLTCTRSDVLPAGNSYPPITLRVHVSCTAPSQRTNTVTATGGGDSTTHTATDPTGISLNTSDLRVSAGSVAFRRCLDATPWAGQAG